MGPLGLNAPSYSLDVCSVTTRVLIVDDSAVMRRALTRLIETSPGFEIVDTARDGRDALDKIARYQPDLVTMDIEMPVMTGLQALRQIARMPEEDRPAVLMCSTLTVEGSREALEALRLGAVDFFPKDPEHLSAIAPHADKTGLVAKLRAIAHTRRRRVAATANTATAQPFQAYVRPMRPGKVPDLPAGPVDLVVIGSSTGGPPVVEQVLHALPRNFPAAVVIAQHMPETFTASLSRRLNESCSVPVFHGVNRTPITPGTATIIQGGAHGRLVRRTGEIQLHVGPEPADAPYRPSVDVLFGSAAAISGKHTVGFMLTGMGDDGRRGAAALRAAKAPVYTQTERSCVVYGMPKAVDEDGNSSGSMDPDQLAGFIAELSTRGRRVSAA